VDAFENVLGIKIGEKNLRFWQKIQLFSALNES
jgi:hypothetical protein